MDKGARRAARCLLRWWTAAFDDEYANVSCDGTWKASMEPTLMIRAGSSGAAAAWSNGSSACTRKNGPLTLTSKALSQPDSGYSAIGAAQSAPALFTSTSSVD